MNPNDAAANAYLGFAYLRGKDDAETAFPYLEQALRTDPNGPGLWGNVILYGVALSMLGRHAEAIEACRQGCRWR